MSFETKERIVVAFLTVLAVWPPIHHVIVRMTDLSPWKGAAWSMYCVPSRSIRVAVISLDDGRSLPLADRNDPRYRRAYVKFVDRRKALGGWAKPPNRVARAVFDLFPEVDRIEIVVEQAGVGRASATLDVERLDRYSYDRSTLLE